jgi:hypothetical protein
MSAAASDGEIVRKYIELRDVMDARAKARVVEDAPIHEAMTFLEGVMAIRMNDRGDESIRTEAGTCYRSRTLTVRTADKEVLFDYIRTSDNFQLLAGNLAKDAVKDFMSEHQEQPPPGVDVAYIVKTLFRRA